MGFERIGGADEEMTLKELKPKYETLELYFDKENLSLMEVPQIMKYDFALSMYAERKVIFSEVHEDKKRVEVFLENDKQFEKRKNFAI